MFPTVDSEDISQVTSLKEKPSVSSDVRDSSENSPETQQNYNRELTINMLIKEMVFFIALALTTYGALHNTPSKVSKHPQAMRFFNSGSVVTDWYRGQLGNALAAVNLADVSFIMYYAPWDAESQFVRGEFELAANVLKDRVHFSAINCWNPGSECRLQHNKIPSWPILMAYTVNSRGVLYKGPKDAHSMVNFLELIMKPLVRISSTEDLVHYLSIHDAVAVGYTPLSDTSRYYNTWYNVALKSREFDTVGEICFAVVTSADLAADLGVGNLPNARLMLWNDTKEFKVEDSNNTWNESTLMHWVLENFAQPVARIIPMWKKSFNFERYADGSPMLILFTPLNPLYEQLPSYTLLREVAMEYYNCKNNDSNQWITELIKLQQVQRLIYQQKDQIQFCENHKFKSIRKPSKLYKKEIVSNNNKYPWNNVTQKSQKNGVFDFILKQGLAVSKVMQSASDDLPMLSSLDVLNECSTKFLPAEKSFYENYEKCQMFDDNINKDQDVETEQSNIETTMLPDEDDLLSTENLIEEHLKHSCRLLKFAQQLTPAVRPARVRGNITHIDGLSCATNTSLYMIALDSVQNHHFAEALGIDVINMKDMTAVVILDSKSGNQYVLKEEYSAKSVRDFISKFHERGLKPTLRSHVAATHTHYYGSSTDLQLGEVINITDLTSRTFRKFITSPGTVNFVCVCLGSCGAHVSRALLGAARLLNACGVRARPARIDAARHDLPAKYDVHHLPALLVFLADGKGEAESRAYPVGARVSASGLAALAMRSLGAPQHLTVRLALCSQHANMEKKSCLRDIREQTTTMIGRNLKYWRRTDVRELKDSFYKRLQHLNQVSLQLSFLHTSDLKENNPKLVSLINSIRELSKVWEVDISMLRKNAAATTR
ncbi:Thioredoxin domain-containing protein 11 [Papilio xuthus]|uniref:Thioredoxin domain-containing protein 11 n=1 Tax=Papilio xuthus TaxID=66420 RepID=A0A194QBM4_PAPXU|nr:Thioredoxin domain-containing protein 11 [Papilio xuthus]